MEAFISTVRRRSPGTSELVSISMPACVQTPLNVSTISKVQAVNGAGMILNGSVNFTGSSEYILSLQINTFASGGLTFVQWRSDTDSVVVRHCPLLVTVQLSHDTLEPTSRLLQMLGRLLTKGCALFVIRSLRELRVSSFLGPMAMGPSGGAGFNSWASYLGKTWTGCGMPWEPSFNTDGVKQSSSSLNFMTKPFHFVSGCRSGRTAVREFNFSPGSLTMYSKKLRSTWLD